MIFNGDFHKNDEKEKNKNYELSEKDFNEINKDISKALIEMEKEKDSENENSDKEDDDDNDEEEKNINDFDLFFSNNSSISSLDPFNGNSEKSFKSIDVESSKNNLEKNFKKKFDKINNINGINNVNIINLDNKNIDIITPTNNKYTCNNWNNINNSYLLCINKLSGITKKGLNSNEDENKNFKNNNNNSLNFVNEMKNNFENNNITNHKNERKFNNNKLNSLDSQIIHANMNSINIIDINQFLNNNLPFNNNIKNINHLHNYNLYNNSNHLNNNYINYYLKNNNNVFNQRINIINQNYNLMLINNNNNLKNFLNYCSFSEGKEANNKNKDSPKNIIHIDNIIKGKDKRTTLIIRNIPNRYTISLLLNEIQTIFMNKFDILYLPQDYINNSNLGYGFINFIDHIHLILFYEKYQGKKWNNFNSNKKCQLAYSKYQGKNELVKYVYKKLGINCYLNNDNNINDNDKLLKSLFINNENNYTKPALEIPIKYYNIFIKYFPSLLCHFPNDKIFIIDDYYNFKG